MFKIQNAKQKSSFIKFGDHYLFGMIFFYAASFLGAFLLFQVQPMAARILAPRFGGGMAVWISCMVFFQAALIAGYSWAHFVASPKNPRFRNRVQGALMAVSLFFLPLGLILSQFEARGDHFPAFQIIQALTIGLGIPYLALASTTPLIQKWFHLVYPEKNPWKLYALSNLGSLLGLLSYPIAVEYYLGLKEQGWGWSILFLLWIALMLRCMRLSSLSAPMMTEQPSIESAPRPTMISVCWWIGLGALGTILFMGCTNLLCLDIVSFPFLWVLPLSLYLISFILSFGYPRFYRRGIFISLLLASVFFLLYFERGGLKDYYRKPTIQTIEVVTMLFQLVIGSLIVNGELVRTVPRSSRQSLFYILLSTGGFLGGIVVGILAPLLFSRIVEFHGGLAGLFLFLLFKVLHENRGLPISFPVVGSMSGLTAGFFALFFLIFSTNKNDSPSYQTRTFYGLLKVCEEDVWTTPARTFTHGVTQHGFQYKASPDSHLPTAYFGVTGGVGKTLLEINRLAPERPLKVGVLGLGIGTLAYYARENDIYRFYEIDARVIDLAKQEFTYLSESKGKVETVLGDARLSLEREKREGRLQNFDLLVIDTFSSDSIPLHMITSEAMELYLSHLNPQGTLAFHISNKNFSLKECLQTLSAFHRIRSVEISTPTDYERGIFGSVWFIMTKNPDLLQSDLFRGSESLDSEPNKVDISIWSDNQINLWKMLRWKHLLSH